MRNDVVTTIDTPIDIKPKTGPGSGRINIAEAIKLRLQNDYTYQQLSEYFKVSRQAIHQSLRRFSEILDNPTSLDDYHSVRGDILSAVEMKLLAKIVDKDTLQKASLNNAAYAFDKLFNANRLERDKSTSNIALKITDAETSDLEHIARQMAVKALSVEDVPEVEDDSDNQGDSEGDSGSDPPPGKADNQQ